MKQCLQCNKEITEIRRRKFCSTECNKLYDKQSKKLAPTPVARRKTVDHDRVETLNRYIAGEKQLTHKEKQALWWNLWSYRQLFPIDDSREGATNGKTI